MQAYFTYHRDAVAELRRLEAAGVPDLRMRSAGAKEQREHGASWVVEQADDASAGEYRRSERRAMGLQ